METRNHNNQDESIDAVMRAAWFARLAFGVEYDQVILPPAETKKGSRFIQRAIDLGC